MTANGLLFFTLKGGRRNTFRAALAEGSDISVPCSIAGQHSSAHPTAAKDCGAEVRKTTAAIRTPRSFGKLGLGRS